MSVTFESAAAVLAALRGWFEDYNDNHPHRGLGMRSPRKFRALQRRPRSPNS